jgi:hypothetical protein
LVKLYDLNAEQALQVQEIQNLKIANLAEIEGLKTSNLALYAKKRASVEEMASASLLQVFDARQVAKFQEILAKNKMAREDSMQKMRKEGFSEADIEKKMLDMPY